MNNILIINPFGIGDVLFSTPLLKAIKRKYPRASIAYVCNKRTEGILKNNPNVSKIYIFEKDDYRDLWNESKLGCLKRVHSFIKELKKDKYDAVVDMSLGYIFSLLLYVFTAIPFRIGFNYRNRGRFLNHKVDIEGFNKKHVIEYYLELGNIFDLDPQDKEMELTVSSEDSVWADRFLNENGISKLDKICGIIPGCGASWGKNANYRRWAAWKFGEVANYVTERYKYKILIFGETKEMPICAKVQSEMKTSSILACGKTTLSQFAALLNRCDLVITNDGGPLHMAVALKRKTVSIFGPVNPHIYGPYPPSSLHVTVTSNDACRPCYVNFKHNKCETLDCLKNIKPNKVLEAVEALIGQR